MRNDTIRNMVGVVKGFEEGSEKLRREESHVVRRTLDLYVKDGTPRERPKRQLNCIGRPLEDMREK